MVFDFRSMELYNEVRVSVKIIRDVGGEYAEGRWRQGSSDNQIIQASVLHLSPADLQSTEQGEYTKDDRKMLFHQPEDDFIVDNGHTAVVDGLGYLIQGIHDFSRFASGLKAGFLVRQGKVSGRRKQDEPYYS